MSVCTAAKQMPPDFRVIGVARFSQGNLRDWLGSAGVQTMTADLLKLSAWLTSLEITHVVMESTGEFWKPLYEKSNFISSPIFW